jgi:hypothetical protein
MSLIGLLILPIGGLFAFHLVLVSSGRTTNEHVTGKYRGNNFFSRGFIMNFIYLFCGSLTPNHRSFGSKKTTTNFSKINLRQIQNENKTSNENKDKNNQINNNNNNNKNNVNNESIELNNINVNVSSTDSNNRLVLNYNSQQPQSQQDLLELVLKNKQDRLATNQHQTKSIGASPSSSNDSVRSNSLLNSNNHSNSNYHQQQQLNNKSPSMLMMTPSTKT